MSDNLNYKNSGVNIDIANKTKDEIKTILDSDNKRLLNRVGAFASLYDVKLSGKYSNL